MTTKPTPAAVRQYMQQRRESHTPPPSPERVREMLGWTMLRAERRGRVDEPR